MFILLGNCQCLTSNHAAINGYFANSLCNPKDHTTMPWESLFFTYVCHPKFCTVNYLPLLLIKVHTHLCLISRASPCHCDVMPCETAHWSFHGYWSHIMDSLQRMPCGSLQHTFLLLVHQPGAWKLDADGSPLVLLEHQVHAKINQ